MDDNSEADAMTPAEAARPDHAVARAPRLWLHRLVLGAFAAVVAALLVAGWLRTRTETVAEIVAVADDASAAELLGEPVVVGSQDALDFVWSSLGAADRAPRVDFGGDARRSDSSSAPLVIVGSLSDRWNRCPTAGDRYVHSNAELPPLTIGVQPLTVRLDENRTCRGTTMVDEANGPIVVLVVHPPRWRTDDGSLRRFGVNIISSGTAVEQSSDPPDIAPRDSEMAVRWALARHRNISSPAHVIAPSGLRFAHEPVVLGEPSLGTDWDPAVPRCGTVPAELLPEGVSALVGPDPLSATGRVVALTFTDARYRTLDGIGVGATHDDLIASGLVDPSWSPTPRAGAPAGPVSGATRALVLAEPVAEPQGTSLDEAAVFTFWFDDANTIVAITLSGRTFERTEPTCAAWNEGLADG